MNESKSQHMCGGAYGIISCYKYQNINERKQITTAIMMITTIQLLLQISEYQ